VSAEREPGAQRSGRVAALWFGLLALQVVAFHATGRLHGDYALSYSGVQNLPHMELVFWAWFGLHGAIAAVFGTLAFRATPLPGLLARLADAQAGRGTRWLLGAALVAFLVALAIRSGVLLGEPVTDDELAYRLVARTLLAGRLVNPPPIDADFLRNQFVIATPDKWYAKYPIGHPALLALGEALRAPGLVVPLVSAASLLLTAALGRRWFGDAVGLTGALLLLISPQFLFTAATELSQPTAMLCLLAALWATLRLGDEARHSWAAVAGLATGAAILVRPLPGALFALVLGAEWLRAGWPGKAGGRAELRLTHLILALLGPILGLAGLLFVNFAQTGDPFRSGYQEAHAVVLAPLTLADMASSFSGALMRQNFWLFGWPASLLLLPGARPRSRAWLFWGVLAAEYSYRLLVPKTVVSTTGPVYVLEIVPLLALGTASGLAGLVRLLRGCGVAGSREWALSGLLSGIVVMLTLFLPTHVAAIRRGAAERRIVYAALDRAAPGERVVVFAAWLVDPQAGETWAYSRPNPWPDLRDRILFLSWPGGADALPRIQQLLKRLPDRKAFAFANLDGQPRLVPIPRE
jgi:4-amino-4-deoxy-L-arabinose transferase-like glycosyltransferase